MSEYLRKMSVGFRGMMSYIRANESETYLLRTNKTILEISEECGFSDVKYYYSAFKRWYKCTPKQFREQYGKVSEEKIRYLDIIDTKDILEKLLTDHYMETHLFYSDGKIFIGFDDFNVVIWICVQNKFYVLFYGKPFIRNEGREPKLGNLQFGEMEGDKVLQVFFFCFDIVVYGFFC